MEEEGKHRHSRRDEMIRQWRVDGTKRWSDWGRIEFDNDAVESSMDSMQAFDNGNMWNFGWRNTGMESCRWIDDMDVDYKW